MSRRISALVPAALAAAMALGAPAHAATELKLGTFGPPQSFFYVEVVVPWLNAVNTIRPEADATSKTGIQSE